VDQILGADVPGRARGERAAAEAADRRIEDGRTGIERRVRVREAGVPRVVQVYAHTRGDLYRLTDELLDLPGHADPHRGGGPGAGAVAPADELLHARHLRDELRIDEAPDFDPRHAHRGEPVDELRTRVRVEVLPLVLEAVARADVADRDGVLGFVSHRTPSSCS